MQHIGLAAEAGKIHNLEFAGVIASDTIEASKGIARALQLGVPVIISNPENFRGDDGEIDQYGFGQDLLKKIGLFGATVVTQNGWLPWTPDNVIEAYEDSIFNQHPGPLPETKNLHGTQPHATMLNLARLTGRNEGTEVVTHRVVAGMDEGVLVGSTRVPIYLPHDYPKRLQKRALPHEHDLQVKMLNEFTRGAIKEIPQVAHYQRPEERKLLLRARKRARTLYPEG